jgi:hypothetical protein
VYIFGDLYGYLLFDTNVNVSNSGVLYVAYSPRAWC